jgi:hypothetical protein
MTTRSDELLHFVVQIDDVELKLTMSVADAYRVADWSTSIAYLNLGCEAGAIQRAIRETLTALEG